MQFVTPMSQRFRTCSKLHATWWQFGGNQRKNRRKFTLATKVVMKEQQKSHQKLHV